MNKIISRVLDAIADRIIKHESNSINPGVSASFQHNERFIAMGLREAWDICAEVGQSLAKSDKQVASRGVYQSGYYWWRRSDCEAKHVFFLHADTMTASIVGQSDLIDVDDSIVIISPVIESVTVAQTEPEFEWVNAFHDKQPVVRQRFEFPKHEVTIEHNGHKTVIVGIVKQDGDRRTDFKAIHHCDGSVLFQRER